MAAAAAAVAAREHRSSSGRQRWPTIGSQRAAAPAATAGAACGVLITATRCLGGSQRRADCTGRAECDADTDPVKQR
ncbi:MAG TPA: hypothetical protein VLW50_02055 [Streptosporangiaceae bacterium]|nr:hypothetical protein [Streptosporangiaceae bacterium]